MHPFTQFKPMISQDSMDKQIRLHRHLRREFKVQQLHWGTLQNASFMEDRVLLRGNQEVIISKDSRRST